jgi:hypothetical protein
MMHRAVMAALYLSRVLVVVNIMLKLMKTRRMHGVIATICIT